MSAACCVSSHDLGSPGSPLTRPGAVTWSKHRSDAADLLAPTARNESVFLRLTLLTITLSMTTVVAHTDDPFADSVVVYDQGIGATLGYTTPETTLGAPERFTGERFLPGAVTPFFPAFMTNEIVSIGAGGSLVLKFDTPVTDDPNNPYGIDLLVFGNSGFVDSSTAEGTVTGMIGPEGGLIEVSADGLSLACR